MNDPVRVVPWKTEIGTQPEPLLSREWLLTNGLGGYASGTLGGVLTRRYHGFMVAALPTPHGRTMMLPDVTESVVLGSGERLWLSGEDPGEEALALHTSKYLKEFRLDRGLPVWIFEVAGIRLEKRIILLHQQNTAFLIYRLLSGDQVIGLELRPCLQFRFHDAPVSSAIGDRHRVTIENGRYEFRLGDDSPILRVLPYGECSAFTFDHKWVREILYRLEERRGYEPRGDLWSPGFFVFQLRPGGPEAALVISAEDWEVAKALQPSEALQAERERRGALLESAVPEARTGLGAEMVLAADQFIIKPSGRKEDVARAQATGDEVRTVIAGYHWFTDWGRDTMISLEGLTLPTGRPQEARWILRTFSHYIRDGLIPNYFPDGENEGVYHTADATLWFFHAVGRYIAHSNDRATLRMLLPKLIDIVRHHLRGTRFGICIDPGDGLFRQGQEGYQLTWMDAKVEDWVVTPRRGKSVETNALWYNALILLAGWLDQEGEPGQAEEMRGHAERARASFNRRFWYAEGGYLYDVVDGEDGDDTACRPNQLFSFSLDHPVLDEERWAPVFQVCKDRLLTPVGLRSLAPGHPDYKQKYYGDLRSRDAAYHQGTVWGWLIGPFIDAYLKLHPSDRKGARQLLTGFEEAMNDFCVGSIAEIFDAEEPFTPRGCIAQAWSVAEVLRCWVKTAH